MIVRAVAEKTNKKNFIFVLFCCCSRVVKATLRRKAITIAFVAWLSLLVAATSNLSVVPAQSTWPDTFQSLDNWQVTDGNPQIDASLGKDPPSLRLNSSQTRTPTIFGSSSGGSSLYLKNPATTDFQNGVIEFDVFFDNDPTFGDQAVVTFRMLDANTYYGALLANTAGWHSNFIMVRNGVITSIGNESDAQVFPSRVWSHVSIVIESSTMKVFKDGGATPIFSAEDSSWSEGKWGGIGLYSAYYNGVFHIDNFNVHDTSIPLTFVSPFTHVTTLMETSVSTTSSTTTSYSTSTTTIMKTTNTTSTSTIVKSRIPVPDMPIVLFAVLGLAVSAIGGALRDKRVVEIIVVYEIAAVPTFVLGGISQMWFTFDDAYRIMLALGVMPLFGLVFGWFVMYLKSRDVDYKS